MKLQSLWQVRTGRDGVLSRRAFLGVAGAGAAGACLGWKDAVALHAAELRKEGRACILLFMRGGPSQFETFDPKPGATTGGPTKGIDTAVSGIQIAENWPNVAKVADNIAFIRSMNNREGEHLRASYQLHTGYAPSGAVKYPSIGSVVASELGPKDFDLPHYVSVGGGFGTVGSGFLGMSVAPFVVNNPEQVPNNVALPGIAANRFERRVGLLKDLETDFASAGGGPRVAAHQDLYKNAARMVLSPRLDAFNLASETDAVRDAYGRNGFGQGCLLARRLVERGVTFVEVGMNGWDTHQDNFNRTKTLSTTVDKAMASLITELKERGRLDKTLIIWMGEFGRTPRINGNTGRDHYPRAFNVALAGGGIKGGRVIGKTSDSGSEVKERPVSVNDLFCSLYQALGINAGKENMSGLGRPIKIVDGGKAVSELF
ncbi:MAG: DUF1501 domain-containing protein [Gemmataceae bacterium]